MEIKAADLIEVHDDGSWDWEWYASYLYYHVPSRRYFLDVQSGCSCDGYDSPVGHSLDSFETWSRSEALRHTSGDAYRALRDFDESGYTK